jgi:predicted DNA-binding transcriptional regulator AlpA
VTSQLPDRPILDRKDMCVLFAMSESTLRESIRRGAIPPPFTLGKRTLRWRRSDVEAFLQGKAVSQ